jgi:hypothetical protein
MDEILEVDIELAVKVPVYSGLYLRYLAWKWLPKACVGNESKF